MKINFCCNIASSLRLLTLLSLLLFASLTGCSSSNTGSEDDDQESRMDPEEIERTNSEAGEWKIILREAMEEQNNKMYSPDIDSTYLYWLDNYPLVLNGSTKCNIFALNVLYRSGFKTPDENALSVDLFDTSRFKDILPVVGVNDLSKARAADLIIWSGHVIIFESYFELNGSDYAMAWWAGTKHEDNDDNIRNNVCHGKYLISGEYVVRRPVKK